MPDKEKRLMRECGTPKAKRRTINPKAEAYMLGFDFHYDKYVGKPELKTEIRKPGTCRIPQDGS